LGQPVERQNLSLSFFVLSTLIAVSTVWAFYEEFIGRRPWKAYQETFVSHYLVPKAQRDLEVAEAALKSHHGDLEKLKQELAEAEAAVNDPARRGPYQQAKDDLDRLNIKVSESEQNVKFKKSDLDAAYYRYKHAMHEGLDAELKEASREMREIEAQVNELNAKVAQATAERDAAQERFEAFAGRIFDLRKQMDALTAPVDDAKVLVAKASGKGTEMSQYWLPDLNRVDRCENCHTAISTCGFSNPKEIVAERQQMEAAGAVDDAALAKKYCVDQERIRKWAEELAKDPKREAFTGFAVPPVFRSHPFRNELLGNNHPPSTFGCTICHGGEGPQTKGIGWHKFEHGYDDHYWGNWNEPLLDLVRVNGKTVPGRPFVQSMCAECHRDATALKFAPVLSQGRKFVAEIGCYGCHPIDGYDLLRKPGPALTDVQTKLSPAWMTQWIAYPRAWRPHTRMPNFWPESIDPKTGTVREGTPEARLRQDEVTAVAAYLWGTSKTKEQDLPPAPALEAGDADRGEKIVESVGCYACHKVENDSPRRPLSSSEARDFAPDLHNIGAKANRHWLYTWLKNPSGVWHDTRMPNLRLTDQEAADVATFLSTRLRNGEDYSQVPSEFRPDYDAKAFAALGEKGRALINKYGCFGCHDINGFEHAQRIGANLSDFGHKPVELLDFGDAITDPHRQTWANWLDLKLRRPRAYRYERVDTRMPQFDLSDDEVRALMVFLRGAKGPYTVPTKYLAAQDEQRQAVVQGEKAVDFYNCRGCHIIEGQGGAIRDRYSDEELSLAPPILNGEGAKVQPAWVFQFVRHPVPLRPWLKVRMPTFPFSDDGATTLVHFFAASAGQSWPYLYAETPAPPVAQLDQSKKMFETLQCLHCHTVGAPPPGADLSSMAPNLYLAEQRLRPDWIVKWLTDPQKISEGTRMPTFWPEGSSPVPQYYGGDSQKQIEALRDLLMHLREAMPPPPEAGAQAAATPAHRKKKRKG
jgi:cytochrome c2